MSLDGRWIAIAAAELFKETFPTHVRISIYDVAANRIVATLPGHQTHINSLSFSPDSRLLASAGSDTSALLWDVAALDKPGRNVPLTTSELAACWAGLAGTPKEAFDSMWKLVPDKQAVSYLPEKLPPAAAPPPEKEVSALVVDLGSDQFAVRSQASKQLAKLGPAIEAELRKALLPGLSLKRAGAWRSYCNRSRPSIFATAAPLRCLKPSTPLPPVGFWRRWPQGNRKHGRPRKRRPLSNACGRGPRRDHNNGSLPALRADDDRCRRKC